MSRSHGPNIALAVAHLGWNSYQFFLLPLWLLPQSPWWALTLLPGIAFNNPLWSLIHETIHGSFHPDPRINRAAGRLLSIAFGSPWRVLQSGHLLHHNVNRTELEQQEVYDPARTPRAVCTVGYYYQLFFGLYLSELLSPIAFYLPQRWLHAARRRFLTDGSYSARALALMLRPDCVRDVRIDGVATLGMIAGSAICYGPNLWILGLVLLTRCLCISFLDYIYHYGAPVGDVSQGYNLRLPRSVAMLLLNFNLHGVHHRHPRLGWRELQAAFRAEGGQYDGDYFDHALRQLRGPIVASEIPVAAGMARARP